MTITRMIVAATAMAVLPSLALAWQSENRHTVNPLTNGAFEVVGNPGSGGPEYWCAAGDYALHQLGVAETQRIYIARGRGEPVTSDRKSGVQFSLTPPAGASTETPLFFSMRRVGDNVSARFAYNYCIDWKNLEF